MAKIYFTLDENSHLDGCSSTSTRSPDEFFVEIDENHEVLRNPFIFKYGNGELVKDVEYQQRLIAEVEAENNKPKQDEINSVAILELAETLTQMMGGK